MSQNYRITTSNKPSQDDIHRLNAVLKSVARSPSVGGTTNYIRNGASTRTGIELLGTNITLEDLKRRLIETPRVPSVIIEPISTRELELEIELAALRDQVSNLEDKVEELQSKPRIKELESQVRVLETQLTDNQEIYLADLTTLITERDNLQPKIDAYDTARLQLHGLVEELYSIIRVPYHGTALLEAQNSIEFEVALSEVAEARKLLVTHCVDKEIYARTAKRALVDLSNLLQLPVTNSATTSELKNQLASSVTDLFEEKKKLEEKLAYERRELGDQNRKVTDLETNYDNTVKRVRKGLNKVAEALNTNELPHLSTLAVDSSYDQFIEGLIEASRILSNQQAFNGILPTLEDMAEALNIATPTYKELERKGLSTYLYEVSQKLKKVADEKDNLFTRSRQEKRRVDNLEGEKSQLLQRNLDLSEKIKRGEQSISELNSQIDGYSAIIGGFYSTLNAVAVSVGLTVPTLRELTLPEGFTKYINNICGEMAKLSEARKKALKIADDLFIKNTQFTKINSDLESRLTVLEAELRQLKEEGSLGELSSADLFANIFQRNYSKSMGAAAVAYSAAVSELPDEIKIAVFTVDQYVFSELRGDLEELSPFIESGASVVEIRASLEEYVTKDFVETEYFAEHNNRYKLSSRVVRSEKLMVKTKSQLSSDDKEILDFIKEYEAEQANYNLLQDKAKITLKRISKLEKTHAKATASLGGTDINLPCDLEIPLYAFTEIEDESYRVRIMMPFEYTKIQEGGVELRLLTDIAHALTGRSAILDVSELQGVSTVDLTYESSIDQRTINDRASQLIKITEEKLQDSFMGSFVKKLKIQYLGEVLK